MFYYSPHFFYCLYENPAVRYSILLPLSLDLPGLQELPVNTHSSESARNIEVIARKNLSLALQAIAQAGQTEIAQRLNFSTSTVSRIKSERLEEVIKVLAACGLKVVQQDYHGDHAEFIDAALVFAAYGLKAVRKDQRVLNQESV
jgi:hypothetical protein